MRSMVYAVLVLAIQSGPAAAHAILLDSQPSLDEALPEGGARLNSRIDAGLSRLALTRPDRTQAPLPIAPGSPADVAAVLPGDGRIA